ncbi:hypothetical protein [Vibrio atlanticus]|uniref:Uncharacterized protein n=1 Tax=Vibrio atlanticus (strain LGP32) TaxID=575788 RepID=B7VI76_VIBA3|nr:hypothetical protein [Vibrio atlanticus]CAV17313.1 hypothetical protein VS_0291 [Vibrio atlanticus]
MNEFENIKCNNVLIGRVGVGITLKTDVKWLRLMMEKVDERLTRLENKSPQQEGFRYLIKHL